MQGRIITILVAGAVFAAGLMLGFGGFVFAGGPVPGLDITICQGICPDGRVSDKIYDSSFSKTKSIGRVRMEVGDVLLRYGFGGEYINQVTEALEGKGVYETELKRFLLAIGMNEKDTQNILLEFDKLGINKEDATPSAVDSSWKSVSGGELRTPATTPPQQPTARKGGMFIKLGDLPGKQAAFGDSATKSIQDLKVAESKEQREDIRKELQTNRQTLQKSAETLRQNLQENAKVLRENFRENVKTSIGHVDHGKTGRIALAHGKGLRMLNRFRSAMARFDHILGRLESRVQKLENEAQAVERKGKGFSDVLLSAILLIEEAKNMRVENEAKMEELKAKYESLLLGENAGGVAKEAREIAKELKSEIENLHAKLRKIADDIKLAAKNYNSSKSALSQ